MVLLLCLNVEWADGGAPLKGSFQTQDRSPRPMPLAPVRTVSRISGAVDGAMKASSLDAVAGQLDGVGLVGDVDDAAAEDVGHALHLLALLADGAHLDQHQLALDVAAPRSGRPP
jgi:hypothetical protein